ncbi:hypothetical protein [Myceligenerans cantabricum]
MAVPPGKSGRTWNRSDRTDYARQVPDDAATSRYVTFDGVAEVSRVPSSIPMLVVPDNVLRFTEGPVPVTLEHDGREVGAWAWAERAWSGADRPTVRSVSAAAPTFALSRILSSRLGIAGRTRDELCAVSVHVPVPVTLSPVMPLVDDLPRSNEVQVPAGLPGPEGAAVMIRNGVAASVVIVVRDHVRSGTARISNHLRVITEPAAAAGPGSPSVVLLHLHRGRLTNIPQMISGDRRPRWIATVSRVLQATAEGGLRWFFRAEEQAMRVVFAHPYDEHQHVVSLTDGALSRLGVRSGDKAVLNWLGNETEITVLQDHAPEGTTPEDGSAGVRSPGRSHDPTKPGPAMGMSPHLAIRVPTALRHLMHLPAASIVTVRRSTRSVLARNLNNLIIPVASLALAGAALNDPNWLVLTVGAIATALLGLSRLRMGNRRATPLGRKH